VISDFEFESRSDSVHHGWGSNLGAHSLGETLPKEFFHCIRQNSRGDHVFSIALLIMARTSVALREMHEFDFRAQQCGHDDLRGTLMGPGSHRFSEQYVDYLGLSRIVISHLTFCAIPVQGRLS
jgi:hypothetical protein